jgi:hypothetical protein
VVLLLDLHGLDQHLPQLAHLLLDPCELLTGDRPATGLGPGNPRAQQPPDGHQHRHSTRHHGCPPFQ